MLLSASLFVPDHLGLRFYAPKSLTQSVEDQRGTRVPCLVSAGEKPIAKTVLFVGNVIRYRFGAALILLVTLLIAINPTALAQRGNLDYYAPRTKGEGGVDQIYSSSLNNHLRDGRARLATGDYNSAKSEFEFVLNYVPNDPQALSGLSEVCVRWKLPACDSAMEQWFQRAIVRNPGASPSYVVQALFLHRKNKLEEAVKVYKQAIELAPDSINAHYNIGLAYTDLKQYDLANQHAQKSYALGVSLPGLRARLEKAGKWNPNASLPASEEAKPRAEPTPPSAPEKAPN